MEQWAEVRRMKRVEGLSAREISRRTGLARDTVLRLLAARNCFAVTPNCLPIFPRLSPDLTL